MISRNNLQSGIYIVKCNNLALTNNTQENGRFENYK